MPVLTFDIETIPNEELLPRAFIANPLPTAADAPNNYGPEAAQKWAEKAKGIHEERIVKRMSLDPVLGRVVSIACLSWDPLTDGIQTTCYKVDKAKPIDDEERNVLLHFWAQVSTADRYLTFNGINFDAPFIEKRSRFLGLKQTPINREAHVDLMRETSTRTYTGGFESKSLDELRGWFGLQKATDHSGKDVYNDYKAGDMLSIELHNIDDVNATFEIAKRLNLLEA